jgi:hypothetical protein
LKFLVGTAPVTLSYSITYNYGRAYAMMAIDTTTYFAGGFDTYLTSATYATYTKYVDSGSSYT